MGDQAVGVLFAHIADINFGPTRIKDQLSVRAQLGPCAACAPIPTPASSSALELPICAWGEEEVEPYLHLLIYGEDGGPVYGEVQLPLDVFPGGAFFQAEVELTVPDESVSFGRPAAGVVHILCLHCVASPDAPLTDDIVASWQEDFDIQTLTLLNEALERKSQIAPSLPPSMPPSTCRADDEHLSVAQQAMLDSAKKHDNKLTRLIHSKALSHRESASQHPESDAGSAVEHYYLQQELLQMSRPQLAHSLSHPQQDLNLIRNRPQNLQTQASFSSYNHHLGGVATSSIPLPKTRSRPSTVPQVGQPYISRSRQVQRDNELSQPLSRETRAQRRAQRAFSVGGVVRKTKHIDEELINRSSATICSAPTRGHRRPRLSSAERSPGPKEQDDSFLRDSFQDSVLPEATDQTEDTILELIDSVKKSESTKQTSQQKINLDERNVENRSADQSQMEIEEARKVLEEWKSHRDELQIAIDSFGEIETRFTNEGNSSASHDTHPTSDEAERIIKIEEAKSKIVTGNLQQVVRPRKSAAERRLAGLEQRMIRLQLDLEEKQRVEGTVVDQTEAVDREMVDQEISHEASLEIYEGEIVDQDESTIIQEDEHDRRDAMQSTSSVSSCDSDDDEQHVSRTLCLLRCNLAARTLEYATTTVIFTHKNINISSSNSFLV